MKAERVTRELVGTPSQKTTYPHIYMHPIGHREYRQDQEVAQRLQDTRRPALGRVDACGPSWIMHVVQSFIRDLPLHKREAAVSVCKRYRNPIRVPARSVSIW